MMASINRSQTYPPVLPPCKTRKELANWMLVKLGSPKPAIIRTSQENVYNLPQLKQLVYIGMMV